MKNSLPYEAPWWAEFLTLFKMSKGIICMQPPYINFLRYYEKSITIGSFMINRIQKTCQNIEVYYFYSASISNFSQILWKILYIWKCLDEQNSENVEECRSLLHLCWIHILIFKQNYEKSFTAESILMSRIQTTFQNVEVY